MAAYEKFDKFSFYVELYHSVYRGAFYSYSLNLVNWVVEWVVFRPKRQEVLSPSNLELHFGALVLSGPSIDNVPDQ